MLGTTQRGVVSIKFMKRSGYQYEELQIKMGNNWNAGSNTYPLTVEDAYTRLKTFRFATIKGSNSKDNRSREIQNCPQD